MSDHLSAFEIDALELGALPEDARRRLEAHGAECARCRRSVEETRALAARFSRDVFPRTQPAIARRASRARRGLGWRWALGAVATASILAVAAPWHRLTPRETDDGPDISVKGGPVPGRPALRLFARRAGQVFAVRDGAHLRSGDEVRFVAEAAGLPYLLIASVDGASKVSVYYPYQGERSGAVSSPNAPTALPDSIRLDAAPGPERLFALFSRTPISAAEVRVSLAALAARGHAGIRAERVPPVPTDAAVTVLFEKDPP